MQEYEFVYHSDWLSEHRDTPPLVSVLVEYDTYTGPVYDSPLGGLGVSNYVTSEKVLSVHDTEGKSLEHLRETFLEFTEEINKEIIRRHSEMIDRLRDFP